MSGLCPGCTNKCPTAALCRDDVIEGEIVEAESPDGTLESVGADHTLESVEAESVDDAVAPAFPKGANGDTAREPHGDDPQSSQDVRDPSDGVAAPAGDADAQKDDCPDDQEDKPVRPQNVYHPPTDDRRCHAKSKTTGGQCKQWALPGLKVCRFHGAGGNHPSRYEGQVRARKEKRTKQLEAKAKTILAHEGLEPIEDPILELGKLAASSREMLDALGKRVNALSDVEHFDAKNSVHIRAEVELYERAMDRTASMLNMLVKAGYMEREIQIQEAQAMILLGAVNRALSRLQLPKEQVTEVKTYLAEELRAIKPRAIEGGR